MAIVEAIRPDNREAPDWLVIRERIGDDVVVVEIEAPVERVMSVRATLDEVMEYVYSLLRSIESLLEAAEGVDEKRSPS
ncbi:KEOPS complex subunit Pcc1 [Pyrolobus fumarii]|uniref:KEOPS complex subunit Pcc1 n=1 Tax=Pyrolobus fumarii TaxID=54252 RepID=UPI0009FEB0CB|nr:KEOPS complex subunit Pcc1 [Pyrolobus fumarii]